MSGSDDGADAVDDRADSSSDSTVRSSTTRDGERGEADAESFGWRGWTLLAMVAFSFVVAPVVIVWNPPVIPYWVALVAVPMLPGILLGVTAVWAAIRG
ncbi:MAG: hypothetical protein ACI9YT_002063 [Halobacteriales archaeon]